MCGLVGVYLAGSSKRLLSLKNIFSDLLYIDTLRGEDGTGMAFISDKGGETIYKRALPGVDFLQLATTKRIMTNTTSLALMMGHNRKGTSGGIVDEACHPFKNKEITLCHNGTLLNYKTLKNGQNFSVDSDWLSHAIAMEGVQKTIKEVNGSFALTWYNSTTFTFSVLRNNDRPLFWCRIEEDDAIIYSSEENMLRWAIERNKLTIKGENRDVFSFEKGMLYEFPLGGLTYTKTKVELYIPPYRQQSNSYEYPSKWDGYNEKFTPYKEKETLIKTLTNLERELSSVITNSIVFDFLSSEKLTKEEKKETKMKVSIEGKIRRTSLLAWLPLVSSAEYTCRIIAKSSATDRLITSCKDNFWKGQVCGFSIHNTTKEVIVFIEDAKPTTVATSKTRKEPKDYLVKPVPRQQALSIVGKKSSISVMGKNGLYIPAAEFDIQVASGCLCCGEKIEQMDAAHLTWTSDGKPICDKCADQYGSAGMPFILQ